LDENYITKLKLLRNENIIQINIYFIVVRWNN
jgi:hypothetical protein